MNFAVADPVATMIPTMYGSTLANTAAFDAISRFDGPAKGIMLNKKDETRIVRISNRKSSSWNLD